MKNIVKRIVIFILFNFGFISKILRFSITYIYKISKNLNYDIYTNGEALVLKRISSLKLGIIFDVGANQGEWAKMVSEISNSSNIYSFEIVPKTFLKLQNLTKNSDKINTYNFGLSNLTGKVTINFSDEDDKLSSLVAGKEIHNINWEKIDCDVMRGDDFCVQNKIESIDFLKIDTEGSENLVLEGFDEMFKNNKIGIVQFEYGMTNIYSKFLLIDFYKYFQKYNFKVGKIMPNGVDFSDYNPDLEDFIGPNFIAVNQNFPEVIKLLSIKK